MRRARLLAVVLTLGAFVGAVGASQPQAVSTGIVISQVYGGGGNSGATLKNDFIELYNRGSVTIDVTGWTVQYASAAGTTWQTTALSGSIGPDKYYLIREAAGAGGSVDLPTPDASGSIAMSATSAKVALVNASTILAGSCPSSSSIVDFVGYGSGATCFEGSGPTPTLSNTTAALRNGAGATDTDNNAADFSVGGPNPRNSAFVPPPPPGVCGDDQETRIHAIQGSGASTPVSGSVRVIEGVVVGDFEGASGLNGFFVQEEDADADADPLTSEGIFVSNPGASSVAVGDVVRVRGTAGESFGLTQIGLVDTLLVCSGGSSVTAASATLPVPTISSFEPLEGMLTTFSQTLTATETFNLGRFGEVALSAGGRLFTPTQLVSPGAPAIALQGLNNRSQIQLDDGSNVQNPAVVPYLGLDDTLRIGDTTAGLTGVLGFSFGVYEVHPTGPVGFTRANPRPTGPPTVGGSLRVGGANVLNYFTTLDTGAPICGPSANLGCRGANSAQELERQRAKLVAALAKLDADIVGLTELENNTTDAPLADLVSGMNDATAPGTYAYIATGDIGTDAIRVGIVYKPAAVTPVGAFSVLDSSVDSRFLDTKNRPVLAQTFRENGTDDLLTVAVNHLKSKGSDCNDVGDPDLGDGQGNCNITRRNAAEALVDWLATDPTGSGGSDFLIVGDLNSYAEEDPIGTIEGAGYTNLVESFVGSDAYSFVFQAQSGTLDYALSSTALTPRVTGAGEYHVNADEPRILDYNTEFNPPSLFEGDEFRAADHDPVLVGICESTPPELTVSLSPSTLFPPNHRYVTVQATVSASDKSTPTVELLSVRSNEPDDAPGGADGNTVNDVVVVDDDTFRLRAERNENGTGRIYTARYRATDACGNATVESAVVTVPVRS